MLKIQVELSKTDIKRIKEDINRRSVNVRNVLKREIPTYLRKVQTMARNIIVRSAGADRTGRLESSITVDLDKNKIGGSVYADMRVAPYAEWVEFGHFILPYGNRKAAVQWIPGMYYMTKALKANKYYRGVVIAELRNAFKYYKAGGVHKYAPEMQELKRPTNIAYSTWKNKVKGFKYNDFSARAQVGIDKIYRRRRGTSSRLKRTKMSRSYWTKQMRKRK